MLSQGARIDTKTFKEVFPRGHSLFSKNISLRVSPVSPNGPAIARFAVVVSKKIDKRATKRNSMRRRIYTLVGEVIKNKPIKPGFYIFLIQKSIDKVGYTELGTEIDFLIKNVKI